MDKLTDYFAKIWTKLDDDLDNLFQRRLLKSFNSTFYLFLGLIALFGLFITLLPFFDSLLQRFLYFFGYTLLAFIGLTVAGAYIKRKGIKAKRLYPFEFKKLDFSVINFELLEFDKEERIDFGLLLNKRKVQNKINFKENSKSKSRANYRKLFSLFHVILENGLEGVIDTQKKGFIEMLNESFLMNGDKLNVTTMDSSLSSWKGELKDSKSSALRYILDYQIIFSIKDN